MILGFAGFEPATLDPDRVEALEADIRVTRTVTPPGLPPLLFDPEMDLVFDYGPPLAGHANGLILRAQDGTGNLYLEETYYSIGGGFITTEKELEAQAQGGAQAFHDEKEAAGHPYPFGSAADMLAIGRAAGKTIAEMKWANETARHSASDIRARLDAVWQAMDDCIDRGLRMEGELPGGLRVKRRAKTIHEQLLAERGSNLAQPHTANDWLSVYAMAVNEENAAGGRVVTSPTNGAAGVVPAMLRYYRDHCIGATEDGRRRFLMAASAIGGLIKNNASISGA